MVFFPTLNWDRLSFIETWVSIPEKLLIIHRLARVETNVASYFGTADLEIWLVIIEVTNIEVEILLGKNCGAAPKRAVVFCLLDWLSVPTLKIEELIIGCRNATARHRVVELRRFEGLTNVYVEGRLTS